MRYHIDGSTINVELTCTLVYGVGAESRDDAARQAALLKCDIERIGAEHDRRETPPTLAEVKSLQIMKEEMWLLEDIAAGNREPEDEAS